MNLHDKIQPDENGTLCIFDETELNELGGIESLSNFLVHDSSVIRLILSFLSIGDEGAKHIARVIEQNAYIQVINLRANDIHDEGAKYLADAIKRNTTLKNIGFWKNYIRNEGVKWIAEALKVNTCLVEIDLGFNSFRDEGVKFIAEAIKENSALQRITLDFNDIGNEGEEYIAEAIKENSTLQYIELRYDYFRFGCRSQIRHSLYENILRKKRNDRKFICAFSKNQKSLIRLPFDRLILKFLYYPIMGVSLGLG
jgi:Ran GTPase-activating protein (RanGAP) involved in mRNA processing and transport